ncbi:MAG TPA: winged helix-turn-helix domain-containing protein [Rhizomicrobium sp.]|jgi:Tol biopolymer transport system component/DNA-binding winged helix-turn-helix (wHTH) protein
MNFDRNSSPAGAPIDLARQSDFAFGAITVRPSLCRVIANGQEEVLQPRVMQVLVALARAEGAVVSRDQLIEQCWGGRIVGDDSINRCIAKVRLLAENGSARLFEVETIPRVGYRLKQLLLERSSDWSTADPDLQSHLAPSADIRVQPSKSLRWTTTGRGLAALLAGGAIVAAVWVFQSAAPEHWTVARSEVLIADSLIDMYPAISPDGAMIAWSAGTNKLTRQIYLRRIAGSDPLRLTDDAYDDTSPSWSPDGTQIVYAAFRKGEPCRLFITPVPAGSPREVGRCQMDEKTSVSWSRSGTELFFIDKPNLRSPDRIMRFYLASAGRGQLTYPPATSLGDGDFSLSPDGRWISFQRQISDLVNHQILLDLRTGAERVMIRNADDYGKAWSEDSRTLFFGAEFGKDFALWARPINGGQPSRILSSPEEMGRLSSGVHGLLAVELHQFYDTLARAPAAQGGPQLLVPTRGQDYSPDIARDGAIAMVADRPGGVGLWVMPRGGNFRKLATIDAQSAPYSEPRWSPDGSRIAFGAPIGHTFAIRIVTSEGYEIAPIVFHGSSINPPAWSTDGRSLIFPGRDAQGWRLWRVDLSKPSVMKPISGAGWQYVRTRNNELYGVRDDEAGVWRIDGSPRRITPKPSPDVPYQWAVTGDEIAYVDDSLGDNRQILAQSIHGGPVRVMARVPGYFSGAGFAIDPTSGSIIYATIFAQENDIEMLRLIRN